MPPHDRLAALSRRDILKGFGMGGAALIGGPVLLSACSSGTSTQSGSGGGNPTPGGILTLGASGGGAGDTLDAQNLLTNADYARCFALYEPLVRVDAKGQLEDVLAESMEPNADGTLWTIRVRPGVLTHAGKPFGANDVLFSLNRIVQNNLPGAPLLGALDLNAAKVVDPQTLTLPCIRPFGILREALANFYMFMVPVDYDPKNPVGTGPFKYESFTPGQESTFVKFTDYWQEGKPYLDKVVITNFADETAQVNAFTAGQVDAINYLSAPSVAAIQSIGGQAIISKSGAFGPFTMRVDTAPFSDVRVRTALKLVVDRPQMLQEVFSGYGQIGNDIWGIADPDYDTSLPQRQQDLDQAKSLLRSAGQENLQVEIVTTSAFPGAVQAAEVFSTHASGAGVEVNITRQDPTQFFATSYLSVPFSQDYFPYLPYLVDVMYATLHDAPFNATKFNNPTYTELFNQAMTTTAPGGRRSELTHEMMAIDYNEGGNCIPYFLPIIDGVSSRVHGVQESVTGIGLGGFDWANIWADQ